MCPNPASRNRLLAVALAACLASCGGGGGGGGSSSSSGSATPASAGTLNERVYADLVDRYYWYDQLPQTGANGFSPNDYRSVEALIDGVRHRPLDRFSYVDSFARYTAVFEEGTATNYGIGFVRGDGDKLFIQYTEPNSPARAGGLARGQEVLLVNGLTVAQLDANGGVGVALQSGQTAGTAATFRVLERGAQRDITIASGTYALKTVWESRTLAPGLGYFHVKSFLAPTTTEQRAALADVAWDGVTDLILDLRYNGGGRILVAAELAGTFLGNAFAGQPFARLEFNAKNAGANTTFPLSNARAPSLAVRRVAVLVTPRTCSAAEELIAALRSFVVIGLIASTPDADGRYTCGKPVGFQPRVFQTRPGLDDPNDPVVSAVNFRSVAANGTTDYYQGFSPTCVVADDLTRAVGDPNEAMLAAGRSWLQTGTCPAATATDRLQVQSTDPRLPDPVPPGIGRELYSW